MRRERLRPIATVLPGLGTLLVLLGAVGAQSQDWKPPASWTEPIEPFHIAGNLYYVGSADLTAFLFVTEEGHILIDAPLEENIGMVLGNIRTLGLDPSEIEVHLASHGHFDHTGGLAGMAAATGGEVVLSEWGNTLVSAGGKGDFFLGDGSAYPPVEADRIVGHLEEVSLGGTTLTAHLTPGHTRGCTTWSATIEGEDGPLDLVSVCSLTVLGGYQLVGESQSYPGIGEDFCASVAHLESLRPDLFLASHGSFIDLAKKAKSARAGDESAFVDPEGYRAWVALAKARVESVLVEQGWQGGCEALLSAAQ